MHGQHKAVGELIKGNVMLVVYNQPVNSEYIKFILKDKKVDYYVGTEKRV